MSARRIPVLLVATATCAALGAAALLVRDPGPSPLATSFANDSRVAVPERAPDPAGHELAALEAPSNDRVGSAGSAVETEAAHDGTAHAAPAWEEVRAEFVGRMYLGREQLTSVLEHTIQSPLAPDGAWLEARFGPAASPAALAAAENAMIEHNLRIEVESRAYLDDLALAVAQTIDGDRFEHAPGPILGPKASEPALLIQSQSFQGWNSVLSVRRTEHPELSKRQDEIVRMADKRDEACLKIMRGG